MRLENAERMRPVVNALVEGGICAVEVTMTTSGALEALEACSGALGDSAVLGAGTVLDAETARMAVSAGARFVVSPILCPDVIRICRHYDVVSIPGAFTPTEIVAAWEAGADLVKVFPGGLLGPGYLREVRGPLRHIRLMPTGGVTLDNAADFLAAGAVAVGVGGALVDRSAVERGDYAAISERARRLAATVRKARGTVA
ncbi:4-hydroxy-2-oxoglutarate aldolase [Labilithrix luteola]|uniref:4-hydroxy-2-oxoglutarate aldolase n=1 Tax=Labilithrix luteola TaxID=1391654 RepID=A0A0K1Q3N4_9BACT|nr:4-hydroxy-2-oxoglutarate aldolase [Labilithrix luteola]